MRRCLFMPNEATGGTHRFPHSAALLQIGHLMEGELDDLLASLKRKMGPLGPPTPRE